MLAISITASSTASSFWVAQGTAISPGTSQGRLPGWNAAPEVDEKLRGIMSSIYDASAAAAEEYGLGYDLIAGNDIAAFKKIAEAMMAQGL